MLSGWIQITRTRIIIWGILYKTQKKYDLAEKAFNDALKLDPELKVARENLEAIQNL